MDKALKRIFMQEIPELEEVPYRDLQSSLTINNETVPLNVKCDGAFQVKGKYIFYEIKGYGDDTNSILSAIVAAQLLRETRKYKDCLYYYVGITSGKKGYEGGLRRDAFLDRERAHVSTYVKWAESKGFLRFYGILDIENIMKEVREMICGLLLCQNP